MEIESYRENLKKIIDEEKRELENRYNGFWEIAIKIASLLKEKYGAKRVWVFGSLTKKEMFNQWSDIDMAVEGIPHEIFYKAVGEATSISSDCKVDIVDFSDCSPALKENILKEGILI
ncbi:nucleotidyltransferase family protein [Thermovenabulum sp.]|uniref:nucleotidyltransferase family protein n=1 Tax=Thermovenabulum sp. TaxID=3100335 RepID=UPI003C7C6FD9